MNVDVDKCIDDLLESYADNTEKLTYLNERMSQLYISRLQSQEEEICKLRNVIDLLINERSAVNTWKRQTNFNKFVRLAVICSVVFPNAEESIETKEQEAIFHDFVELLKNKKGFDYESITDWSKPFIKIHDMRLWLTDVIIGWIDPEFVCPHNI